MKERSFIDTNILVYIDDHDQPQKQERSLEIFSQARRSANGVLSSQVLQEYFVSVTRKLSVPSRIAKRKVELFAKLDLVEINLDTTLQAIDLHRLNHFSFWDALIIQCATVSNCSILLTEDLQNHRQIGDLKIVNPYL